jgi:predicted fused transcriptional regulator/phosphomethylpyrimidine kinase
MVKKGDEVSWNTPQGRTEGEVVEEKTDDFELYGKHRKASEDDPQVIVKSGESGKEAAHKESSVDET